MESYIVKIRSYIHDDEQYETGTGIIIAENKVITARHVIEGCDYYHLYIDKKHEFDLSIIKESNSIVLLEISDYKATEIATIFSMEEVLNGQTEWLAHGYISGSQIEHEVKGIGIFNNAMNGGEWDETMPNITSGISANYEGLSGAPVFVDGRIVGVLQQQMPDCYGRLGLKMASVEMFKTLLPETSFLRTQYILDLVEKNRENTSTVQQNIKHKKYIPGIFVEEGEYKEYLRFFADPVLFVSKHIKMLKRIDFAELNKLFETSVTFTDIPDELNGSNLNKVINQLLEKIKICVDQIKIVDLENNVPYETYYKCRVKNNRSIKYLLEGMINDLNYAKAQAILISNKAGQGKTNLLCDFTVNYLLQKNKPVIYLNAYTISSDIFDMVMARLLVGSKYSDSYVHKVLMQRWEREKESIFIIIDGLNENTKMVGFDQIISKFIDKCRNYPYIKVVMTTRSELIDVRFPVLFEQKNHTDFIYQNMWHRKSQRFENRLFYGYLDFFRITVNPITVSQEVWHSLTNDLLLLRFFCEVNEGQHQVYLYDIYKYDVFERYYQNKVEEYSKKSAVSVGTNEIFRKVMMHIAQYMITNDCYYEIPINIFDQEEYLVIESLLENDVILKGDIQVQEGFIEKTTNVISFSFDEFRDFCITDYILTQKAEKAELLKFWNKMTSENLVIKEGVQKYIFYLAFTKYAETLLPIIENTIEYDEIYWKYVWHIEERYISKKDILKWKEMFFNGKYIVELLIYLILKYDTTYFSNVNIKIVFSWFDELSLKDDVKFKRMIRKMFQKTENSSEYLFDLTEGEIWPIDSLIEYIRFWAKNNMELEKIKELLVLTVYLKELDVFEVNSMWIDLYESNRELLISIIEECIIGKGIFLKENAKCILRLMAMSNKIANRDLLIALINKYNIKVINTSIDWEWTI